MPNNKRLLSLLTLVAVVAFTNKLAIAQVRTVSDTRFENMPKALYSKKGRSWSTLFGT